jgi:hypothetical protein
MMKLMDFPLMLRVRQELAGPTLADPLGEVRNQIRALGLSTKVKRGETIAIPAGSRGITNIAGIIRTVVEECRALGLQPFIVPAMGSHGGATAEGQAHVLEEYGITEAAMGCPIKSSMDVVKIGSVKGTDVFCDRNAWEADHIAVVNRVKAHTDFDGEIESGLFKMMAIGLGKRQGAESYHRASHEYSYAEVIPTVGRKVLETARILFGLAIVENGAGDTALVKAFLPPDFHETEKALLVQAKLWMGRLPFQKLDLLIVDEIGKNVSGTGMDPNIIGRDYIQKHPTTPKIRQIFVRDITPESEGNALGIGMADMTTQRLIDKINHVTTNINTIAAGHLSGARVPMAFANDREAIDVALGLIGLTPRAEARVVRVRNTLHLTEMFVSKSLLAEVSANPRLHFLAAEAPFAFDGKGNLRPF